MLRDAMASDELHAGGGSAYSASWETIGRVSHAGAPDAGVRAAGKMDAAGLMNLPWTCSYGGVDVRISELVVGRDVRTVALDLMTLAVTL